MSIPVTTRLSEETVASLNAAVQAGAAPDRASAIATAVEEWLDRHDEERIADSYRRAYDPAYGGTPQTAEELAVLQGAARRAVKQWSEGD